MATLAYRISFSSTCLNIELASGHMVYGIAVRPEFVTSMQYWIASKRFIVRYDIDGVTKIYGCSMKFEKASKYIQLFSTYLGGDIAPSCSECLLSMDKSDCKSSSSK